MLGELSGFRAIVTYQRVLKYFTTQITGMAIVGLAGVIPGNRPTQLTAVGGRHSRTKEGPGRTITEGWRDSQWTERTPTAFLPRVSFPMSRLQIPCSRELAWVWLSVTCSRKHPPKHEGTGPGAQSTKTATLERKKGKSLWLPCATVLPRLRQI